MARLPSVEVGSFGFGFDVSCSRKLQKLHELLRLTFRSLYVAGKISSAKPELILSPESRSLAQLRNLIRTVSYHTQRHAACQTASASPLSNTPSYTANPCGLLRNLFSCRRRPQVLVMQSSWPERRSGKFYNAPQRPGHMASRTARAMD